jgi:hypothetical protein
MEPTYKDLLALALICEKQARAAKVPAIRGELERMAKEYHQRAVSLGNGEGGAGSDEPHGFEGAGGEGVGDPS